MPPSVCRLNDCHLFETGGEDRVQSIKTNQMLSQKQEQILEEKVWQRKKKHIHPLPTERLL